MSNTHTRPRGFRVLPSSGFPQGCCGKVENPAGCHDVKRADYITNSVRCQGKVIFLNKMKGELGRLGQLRNWHNRPFFMKNFGIMQNVQAQSPVRKVAHLYHMYIANFGDIV